MFFHSRGEKLAKISLYFSQRTRYNIKKVCEGENLIGFPVMAVPDDKLPVSTDIDDDDVLSDEDYARTVIMDWGKPIPRQWDNERLKFFKPVEHKPEIQALARGLTIEEALNYYGLTQGVLPEYDALYFVSTYLQGRVKAKSDAVAALFENMRGVQGTQASLAYLNRFAQSFQSEVGGSDNTIKAIKIEVVE